MKVKNLYHSVCYKLCRHLFFFFFFFFCLLEMLCFVPRKCALWRILLLLFNLKKAAAESHWMVVKAYHKHALFEIRCRAWF